MFKVAMHVIYVKPWNKIYPRPCALARKGLLWGRSGVRWQIYSTKGTSLTYV